MRIGQKPTAIDDDPAPRQLLPAEAEASLRAELLTQVSAAQSDLETAITALRQAGGSPLAAAENQMLALGALQRRVSQAGLVSLAGFRSEVSAQAAAVAATVSLAQAAVASSEAPGSLQAASAQARGAVNDFTKAYFKDRKFDEWLTFTSEEDEREFRRRELERQREIERAMALHTPEGDARAAQMAHDQLVDAGAHGADKSPDYAPQLAALEKSQQALQATRGVKAADQLAALDGLEEPPPAIGHIDAAKILRSAGVSVSEAIRTEHGVAEVQRSATQRGLT